MSRLQRAAVIALLACVAVVATGCRRKTAVPDPPPEAAASAGEPAGGIVPDTPENIAQVRRLLAYVATQKLPVPTAFQPVRSASAPAVRSGDVKPHDAWVLWAFFHARESESRLIPVIVPSDGEPEEDGAPDDHARAEAVDRARDTIDALAARDAAEFFRRRELERRAQEERINASLARARAGTPQSDFDRSLAPLCKNAPDQCTPHSELDDQRKELDAAQLVSTPRRSALDPSWSFLREAPGVPGKAKRLRLWLIETSPWLIPLVLEFGGWNDCPADADHAVAWRDWHTRFGASIVYLDRDTLEAWVERPPTSTQDRKRLAWEQYLYCEDIVSQGAGHVRALASELSANTWFFWWD